MALLLEHSVFYHIPKTGGGWVRAALRRAGIPHTELEPYHANPLVAPAPAGYFTFAFVRDPRDWYRSFWAYRMRTQWRGVNNIDRQCYATNFETFTRNIVEQCPGYLSAMYGAFTGKKGVHFVGRNETLVDDLIFALREAGEEFDEAAVRSVLPVNVATSLPEYAERCAYTPELLVALERSERRAIEKFGYA